MKLWKYDKFDLKSTKFTETKEIKKDKRKGKWGMPFLEQRGINNLIENMNKKEKTIGCDHNTFDPVPIRMQYVNQFSSIIKFEQILKNALSNISKKLVIEFIHKNFVMDDLS